VEKLNIIFQKSSLTLVQSLAGVAGGSFLSTSSFLTAFNDFL
jgi:hypothetical protein